MGQYQRYSSGTPNSFNFPAVTTAECRDGYFWESGDTVIILGCLTNGTWNFFADCVGIHCFYFDSQRKKN